MGVTIQAVSVGATMEFKIARKRRRQRQPEVGSELDFANFAVSNVVHSSRRRDNSCFGVVAATRRRIVWFIKGMYRNY